MQLTAEFDDGATVVGECEIAEYKLREKRRILRVGSLPEKPPALDACVEAINQAEVILLGPGSLYTSVIPNLLADGIVQAIHASRAAKIYVMNLMTQAGETAGYTASDHVKALFDHGGDALFDHCLINDLPVPPALLEAYRQTGAAPIDLDVTSLARMGVRADFAPVADYSSRLVRHDPMMLAGAIMDLYRRISPTRIY